MGLLDDAIREHLDLKRARGGDPAEIEKMEREALGPVRREPTIGSPRFEAADEHAVPAAEGGYPDDRDQLLNAGYHDSTAPHQHPHQEYVGHELDELQLQHDDPFDSPDQPEQPKRRFLRRNRSQPAPDAAPDSYLHQDALADAHGLPEHHQIEHHESLAHHDLHDVHEHEPFGHHEPQEHHEAPAAGDASVPPHLQFDQPPKRPRFSTEPPIPSPAGTGEAAEQPVTPSPEARAPQPPEHHAHGSEVQETTEFDVQKHIAETRFQPDPETQAGRPVAPTPQPGAGQPAAEQGGAAEPAAQEDVLEETPEFLQDTPEHDRLWFEQRPPRDFDFDG